MARVAEIRRLYAYNWAVYDAFLRRLRRLPWRVGTRDLGSGHGSMKDTMVHILNVHDAWLNFVRTGRVRDLERTPGRRTAELRSWAEVSEYRDRVRAGIAGFLRSLSTRELHRAIRAPWMPGRYTVEDACLQASFEQAHHLGEIIALLWQRDIEPPEMTWIDTHRRLGRRRIAPRSRRGR